MLYHFGMSLGMERIWKHMDFLGLLATPVSIHQARALISTSTDEQLNIISELALNLLQRRFKFSEYYRKELKKDADFIRHLADRRIPTEKKRSLTLNRLKTTSLLLKVCLKRIRDG